MALKPERMWQVHVVRRMPRKPLQPGRRQLEIGGRLLEQSWAAPALALDLLLAMPPRCVQRVLRDMAEPRGHIPMRQLVSLYSRSR
mmetsp:Transcript_141633/g.200568  ORF Transcript_141633/g.200568 Transcript_141633/m.200568 type:complete len:86 (-) Transcript_141633:162-419(-)